MDQQSLLNQIAALQQRVDALEAEHGHLQAQTQNLRQHLEQERAERQQLEAALQQQEEKVRSANERFQLVARAVNALIYDWDIPTDRVERTEGLTRILGYSLAETEPTGQWWREQVHPEDLQKIMTESATVLVTGDHYTGEYRIRQKNGQYVHVLDQALVVARDADGKPMRIIGGTTNISDRVRLEVDRKQAETALQEREQRFSTLFNGMEDWVLVYHLPVAHQPGRLIEVNEQACKKLGYTRQELLQLSVTDIIDSSSIDPLASIERIRQETHIVVESIHRTKDGRLIPVEVSATLFYLNGIPTIQAICRDITKRKATQEALERSERLYRAIGETIDYGIWVCDPDGRNTYASESFLKLVGLTQEECSEFGWGQVLHPDDAEQTIAAWKECVQTEGNWDIVHRYRGVDGHWHPILARGVPVKDENGTILCWAGINLDISRQKRAEETLRKSEARTRARAEELEAIMQITPVAIWIAHDPQCHHITANQTAYQLMRTDVGAIATATPPDGSYSLKFRQRQNGQDLSPQELPMQRAAQTGQIVKDEIEFLFDDGTVRFIYGSAVPLRDELGKVRGVIGAFVDITDRKYAEQEREQLLARESTARQEAETANRIKDEFLAVLSHELRSPLNPILGWTKLLLTRNFDAQATRNALETIERNAKLQTQLIEDLLDVSRILRRKMVLQNVQVDLRTVIEGALETVQLAAEAKSIQIHTMLNPHVGNVAGDPNRLQQAVWNLLSNAVKFTATGGQVEVRLEQVAGNRENGGDEQNSTSLSFSPSSAAQYAQIQVRDTGKGISPDFLPYVFDYFRQEDGKTTRQFGGLGLGLAIVYQLIEQHAGTISVDSAGEGMGATFTIRLPIITSVEKLPDEQASIEKVINLNHLRILVVDDDADMRKLIEMTLQQYGAEVLVVASAAEGLSLLDQFQPDVLISDIGMAYMDGYQLIQQVRNQLKLQPQKMAAETSTEKPVFPNSHTGSSHTHDRRLRAIALTAYAGESDRQKALEAGFDLHLSKPVDSEELVKAIMRIL